MKPGPDFSSSPSDSGGAVSVQHSRTPSEETGELERLRKDLAQSRAVCRDFSAQLKQQAQALQQQREIFSRELHDETAQHLTALSFGLKTLEGFCPVGSPSRKVFDQVKCRYQSMADAIHNLSLRLRPESVEELGLCPALLKYLEDWGVQHNVAVSFETTKLRGLSVPLETEVTIYRVVQEALTNVVRHAEATSIRVEVHGIDGTVYTTIEDNGCGFDVDKVMASTPRLGLKGLQERAHLGGGSLQIESAPQQGTIIHFQIPLPLPQEANQAALV
jgi:signal transduction histidine kinase